MSDQLAPFCAIERRPLRPGDNSQRIRLAPQDITPEALKELKITHEIKPGLYSCGPDAFEVFSKVVAKRLIDPKTGEPYGDPALVPGDLWF